MGVSRVWDGSPYNYFQTPFGSPNGVTAQVAWVRPSSILASHLTIFGGDFGAGYGWRISSAGRLELFWNSGANVLGAPLLISGGAIRDWLQIGKDIFLAINKTSAGGITPVTADFYAGHYPTDVQFIGTDSNAGPAISTNGVQIVPLGGNNNGIPFSGAPIENPMKGAMKRIGRWNGINLTLAELQEVARCGGTVKTVNIDFFFEMFGVTPELNVNPLGTNSNAEQMGSVLIGPDLCSEYPDVNISLRIGSLAVAPPPVFPPPPVYPPATPPAEDEGDVEQSPFACVDVI